MSFSMIGRRSQFDQRFARGRCRFLRACLGMLLIGVILGLIDQSSAQAGLWPWSKKKEESAAPKDRPQAPPPDTGSLNAGIRNLLLDAHAAYQKGDLTTALRLAQRAEKLAKASEKVAGKPNELEGTASRFVAEITRQLEEKNKSLAPQEPVKSGQEIASVNSPAASENTRSTDHPKVDSIETMSSTPATPVGKEPDGEFPPPRNQIPTDTQVQTDESLRNGDMLLQSTAPVVESITSSSATSQTVVRRSQTEKSVAETVQATRTDLPEWAAETPSAHSTQASHSMRTVKNLDSDKPLEQQLKSSSRSVVATDDSTGKATQLTHESPTIDHAGGHPSQPPLDSRMAFTTATKEAAAQVRDLPVWAVPSKPDVEPEAVISLDEDLSAFDDDIPTRSNSKRNVGSKVAVDNTRTEIESLRAVVGEKQLPGWREITPVDIHQPARLDPLLRMQVEMAAAATRDLRRRILDTPRISSQETKSEEYPSSSSITLASNSRESSHILQPVDVSHDRKLEDPFSALRTDTNQESPQPLVGEAIGTNATQCLSLTPVRAQAGTEQAITRVLDNSPWVSQAAVQIDQRTARERENTTVLEADQPMESGSASFMNIAMDWLRSYPVRIRWIMAASIVSVFALLWWYGGRQLPGSRTI